MSNFTPTGYAHSGKWVGRPTDDPRGFTVQQLLAIEKAGLSSVDVETRTIKLRRLRERSLTEIRLGVPGEMAFEEFFVDCPIVSVNDGSVTVITPGGDRYALPAGRRRGG